MDILARYAHYPDSMFTGPSTPNLPKPPGPPALPEVDDSAAEGEARKMRKRRGRRQSVLTGSLEPETGKQTTLG